METIALKPRTEPRRKTHSLATELASIRAAGFTTSDRMERFTRRLLLTAANTGLDASELYDRVVSLSLAIREDDARAASGALAVDARRKAV